jgi:hypothetical protein
MVTTFREMKRGVEKQRRGREERARRAEHELWLAADTDIESTAGARVLVLMVLAQPRGILRRAEMC